MITRLRWCVYAHIVTMVVLVLWAMVSAASPAAASAKASAQASPLANDPQSADRTAGVAESVVVAPGESLWSISERWLGPEATPEQIADGAERIYALNLERIGDDPNLLLAGQRLSLPAEVERRAPEPDGAAANQGSGPTAATAADEADRGARQARGDAQSQPAFLPDLSRAVPVAAIRPLARNDSPPSPAESAVSGVRSGFSAVVATAVGEAFSPGSYPGRTALGGALVAMSSLLALILAVGVAREVWGPSYARRRARRRWVRETLARSYAPGGTFDPGDAFAALEGGHPSQEGPRSAPAQTAAAGGLRTRGEPSGNLANGSALLDTAQDISRHRRLRIRQARPLEAKRRPRGGRVKGASGASRLGRTSRAHQRPVTRAQRARALSRKGIRIVASEPRGPHPIQPTQEWKIGEQLTSAISAIPVHPGAPLREALLEVKPLVAAELMTVASLERHRSLAYYEQRRARALRGFLATIEEVSSDARIT